MAAKAHTGPLYPEADLVPDANDELISSAELEQIGLFGSLKRKIRVEEAPGSLLLRRFLKGEVICRQGEPGHSAFYLVPSEDMLRLRQFQLKERVGERSSDQVQVWQQDVESLERYLQQAPPLRERVAARAYLLNVGARRKTSWWQRLWGGRRSQQPALPDSIAVDGPSEISTATRNAPLYEDDIFGEMSCLMFTPRSATVVAERECFAVEFRRNILDSLQRDESFRRRVDEAYRERVLNSHLRRLRFLEDLTDEELAWLRPHVELCVVNPGDVIFEEGDPADAAYIVRSGLVQIVQDLNVSLKPEHIERWPEFCRYLVQAKSQVVEKPSESPATSGAAGGAAALLAKLKAAKPSPAPQTSGASDPTSAPADAGPKPLFQEQPATRAATPLAWLWVWLAPHVQAAVERIAGSETPDRGDCALVAEALNQLCRQRKWLKGAPLQNVWKEPAVGAQISRLPRGLDGIDKDWTDIDCRVAARTVLAAILPQFIASRSQTASLPRIVRYMGRGECFGEVAVVRGAPRTASAIAYDHPSDDQRRVASRVELVRIPGQAFREFLGRVPRVADRVERQLARYQREDIARRAQPAWADASLFSSPEFRDEGLIQGQKLLLIDLDRCTRCGDCVRACIRTHEDGYTRLFLDGPRFGRFLIPAACRQCRDPLCMIGCPVGSIQRGDNGEIVIRDWCIGCGLCARQCPYDSIQMHDVGLITESALGWQIMPESAVGSSDWWQVKANVRHWPRVDAPFRWSPELAALLAERSRLGTQWQTADRLLEPICLRYEFVADSRWQQRLGFVLECETKAGQVDVWLNGQPCTLERGVARVDAVSIRTGKNCLALRLSPSEKASSFSYEAPLLRVWLGALPEVGGLTRQFVEDLQSVNFKLQAARAVVCDLCSHLPGQQPACVTECPHAAAMRVDAFLEFPAT